MSAPSFQSFLGNNSPSNREFSASHSSPSQIWHGWYRNFGRSSFNIENTNREIQTGQKELLGKLLKEKLITEQLKQKLIRRKLPTVDQHEESLQDDSSDSNNDEEDYGNKNQTRLSIDGPVTYSSVI